MTTPLPARFLLDRFEGSTDEEVHEMYAYAVDRWTWDTGSDEDAKLIQEAGTEHRWRKSISEKKPTDGPIEQVLAQEIADELDREILRDIINLPIVDEE